MNDPLISICVPAYNGEYTVLKAVNSILSQTYKNIEVIVVDDCSPDNTYEILKSIKDQRLKLYKNDSNLGMVGNWNKCVSYATGQYVHMLHSDDILYQTCIEEKVNFLKKHLNDNVVIIFNSTQIINESDDILMVRRYKNNDLVVNGKLFALESLRKRNIYGEPSNVLFDKKIFDQVGGFYNKLRYVTDWDLWIRMSLFGNIGYIDKILVKYRVSTTNVTSSLSVKQMMIDDQLMLKNIQSLNDFKMTTFQVAYHKFVFICRAWLRFFYMKIFAH